MTSSSVPAFQHENLNKEKSDELTLRCRRPRHRGVRRSPGGWFDHAQSWSECRPYANSGVTTTKTGTGQYTVTLPAGKTQAEPRDLVFVTPKGPITSTPYSAKADNSQPVSGVDGSQPINVGIYGGSPLATFADADFSIVIMRTIIP